MPALFPLNAWVKLVDLTLPPYVGRVVGFENVVPEEPYTDGRTPALDWVYYIKVAPKHIVEVLQSDLVAGTAPSPDPQR